MIKVYKVKIGEKVYEVEIESVTEVQGNISTPEKKVEVVRETSPKKSENAIEIDAPMQGLVVSVEVNPGDIVKAGDTLVVLEAMKMENPIVAPQDGEIQTIEVKKGDTIDGGTLLVTMM
ncbi:biotin/lipoyl-containing protein [uncultured Cetobacterium sp.]|uniref:biotin/lipoyl-containing protein n=1 Tax=uncultured Cetobacterium sp. TaxID=527638 RepID=UPI00261E4553|nr:biotin/lipoyl-containing protein [uncultured Cetobacterium sp.]